MNRESVIIETKALEKEVELSDGKLQILKPISFKILEGESVAIVGISGSGKSTLLGLLAGLDLPSSGSISVAGKMINTLTEDERAEVRANNIGFVFQSFQLMPNLTALENVMLPLELKDEADITPKAKRMLESVGLLERLNHYPSQLSGGEQQRVALARAFVSEPRVLFADEPTGNLDAKTGELIADLLFKLNANKGTTLVLVTHDQKLAQRCQRILTMESGELTQSNESSVALADSL